MDKKKRGAQPDNKNAAKSPERRRRKVYYPTQFFGLRWDYEIGQHIEVFLRQRGMTQRDVLKPLIRTICTKEEPVTIGCSAELFQALSLAAIDACEASVHEYIQTFLETAHHTQIAQIHEAAWHES